MRCRHPGRDLDGLDHAAHGWGRGHPPDHGSVAVPRPGGDRDGQRQRCQGFRSHGIWCARCGEYPRVGGGWTGGGRRHAVGQNRHAWEIAGHQAPPGAATPPYHHSAGPDTSSPAAGGHRGIDRRSRGPGAHSLWFTGAVPRRSRHHPACGRAVCSWPGRLVAGANGADRASGTGRLPAGSGHRLACRHQRPYGIDTLSCPPKRSRKSKPKRSPSAPTTTWSNCRTSSN